MMIPVLAALAAPAPALPQHPQQHGDRGAPMYVAPASPEAAQAMQAFQLAPGLSVSLVAAEPDLCNVVAFALDERGNCYVSETFRIKDGVFDTRDYMQWKDEDLACRTVAHRLAKYERHIAAAIPRYAAFTERVRLLVDTDRDGVYDRSTVFAADFAALSDGIASGVLPVGDAVWFANIPKLWRLRDRDGDGVADEREAVFDGFGVHTSLIGHDLHGLIVGPDRRLYFSIGDRGFAVRTREGALLDHPHEGAVLRCELDGSGLEVVHRGLRNPQELAFDDHGNLFTGDNNSDSGDKARFVQIVPGADSGWRIGNQWLDDRGRWNRERMWWPQHPGQPAWMLPPVVNIADGPAGLAFDPGTGLPERYRGCFFLCDFRGGAGYSGVHALRFVPRGAGFELASRQRPIWGVLCTDLDFGPDGALYVSDWVHGWDKTGKGRLYRVERTGMRNDLQARAVAQLIGSDLTQRAEPQLLALLGHADRRVRQKAQFALVDRGAAATLLAAARTPEPLLARLHGIWGLGILGRREAAQVEPLLALLDDGDAEVRAQTAKVLGDARCEAARSKLIALLRDDNSRARCEAALALGRLGAGARVEPAQQALAQLLRDNDDRDPVLRHAAVMGLCGAVPPSHIVAMARSESRAERLGAVLALHRLGDVAVAAFLDDRDASVRAEAARAVYDGEIAAALPQLSAALPGSATDDPAFAWRALNAARLLGGRDDLRRIAAFAGQDDKPTAMRIEAVRILAEWPEPGGQCRIVGNWRPCAHADDEELRPLSLALLRELLLHDDAALATAAAEACGALRLHDAASQLAQVAGTRNRKASVRVAALEALDRLGAGAVDEVVANLTDDDPVSLRKVAVGLLARRDPARAVPVLATLCRKASLGERQAAFRALGTLPDPAAATVLAGWLEETLAGKVDAGVQLDLLEAAEQRQEPLVRELLQRHAAAQRADDPLAAHRVCLEGGDAGAGRRIFFDNEQTRCTRCHQAEGRGGTAGPRLDGIGKLRTREYLLQALVQPGAVIADGYATTVLELHSGEFLAGVLVKDQDGMAEIMNIAGETQSVPWNRIKARRTAQESAMPAMAGPLDRRQLRDLVAFLAGLDRVRDQ